ncbi:MAG: hypothetical protein ABSG64_04265 [Solirubrobacteraceae bacterium]|jgi:hypothetical protein
MRRTLVTIITTAAVLLVPAIALATITEVGIAPGDLATVVTVGTTGPSGTTGPTSTTGLTGPTSPLPTCSASSCEAVTETTGYQVKVGTDRGLLAVPKSGVIVAWTITLGSPTAADITYYNTTEGFGPASAGIAVLKNVGGLKFKLIARSPAVQLLPYFGEKAQFPLAHTITVTKGEQIALSVPTWAPALAIAGYGGTTSWRASRSAKDCDVTGVESAQLKVNSTVSYPCLYQSGRLEYSATLITTP